MALFIILQEDSGFLLGLRKFLIPHTRAHEETFAPGHTHEEGESLWHVMREIIHYGSGVIG